MKKFKVPNIDWEKCAGLVPAIIQESSSGQILMLGYMNQEALACTCDSGKVTFYSRSKQRLWMKGETSGQILQVVQILADCDEDTLLILAQIEGACCHLGEKSCFGESKALFSVLTQLEELIISRSKQRPPNHYTTQLFEQGIKRIAQKVGEEGVELALAAMGSDREEILNEGADLLYHFLVLLTAKEVFFWEVLLVLQGR
jgi:phosphoribosyl-ATP pyrophosphohydrolase/phosphoribosyl-AMP cyclohydrolase